MILNLIRRLKGWRDYKVTGNVDAAADLLALSGTEFRELKRSCDTLTFSLTRSQCSMMEAVFKVNLVEYLRE